MLQAYFDDSNIGQGPIYVLAGWIGDSKRWPAFSSEWNSILNMRPRVDYFKFSEAISCSGQFFGFSEESRAEKMRALMALIEEYQLVAISVCIPDNVFRGWFGYAPHPYGNPYFVMLYRMVARVIRYAASLNYREEIDFVFDTQTDQMKKILNAWSAFVQTAPKDKLVYLENPPRFENDKYIPPLQAADFAAGWIRTMNTALELGRSIPVPPWHPRGIDIRRETTFIEWWHAEELYIKIFGGRPITYTFGSTGTEFSAPPRLHLPSWPAVWPKIL
jgi:hypothetical protein